MKWVGLLLFAGFCVFWLLEIIEASKAARQSNEETPLGVEGAWPTEKGIE